MNGTRKIFRRRYLPTALLFGLVLAVGSVQAHDNHQLQQLAATTANMDHSQQDHAAHVAMMNKPQYSVSEQQYEIPDDMNLIDQQGNRVQLRTVLEVDEPLALNFIFTTCNTICPVMTASFSQMRRELGESGGNYRFVSISIDPQYDRPEVLREYAKNFGAGPDWTFLTGNSDDIGRVLRAFDGFTGSKLNHQPASYFRKPHSDTWIRIDGLASGADLAREAESRLLQ